MSLLVVDEQMITAAQSQAEVKTLVASQMTAFSELVTSREQQASETLDTYDLVEDELARLASIERIRDLSHDVPVDDYILGLQSKGFVKGGYCPIGYDRVEDETECMTTFVSFLKSKGKPDAHAVKGTFGNHTKGCWMDDSKNHDRVHFNTLAQCGFCNRSGSELPVCKRKPGAVPFDVTKPPEFIDDNCVPKRVTYNPATHQHCKTEGMHGKEACEQKAMLGGIQTCEWKGPNGYVAPPVSCVGRVAQNPFIQALCRKRTTESACIAKFHESQANGPCKWNA